jgi:hypothetical protein
VNSRDVLALSLVLVDVPKKAPEEASWRGATGRAYYAAFTFARDALFKGGHPIQFATKDHALVPELLALSSNADVAALANLLQTLRRNRNECDYDVGLKKSRVIDKRYAQKDAYRSQVVIDEVERVQKLDARLFIP